MNRDDTPPAVARLWQMADLITPLAIRVAATLRLADHVAAGHDRLADLARRAGADEDALARLIRYLTARGLFEEKEPARLALTELGALLADDHPMAPRRWLDLEGFGGKMDLAFVDLLATVRTGRPPEQASEADLSDPLSASFDDVMEAQSRLQTPAIVEGYDWSSIRHVADLGGGTGTLLVGLLLARRALRGTLVELPRTAERAARLIAREGLAERCEIHAGDLFSVALPRTDLYILKFVLHGLEDERAVEVLRRCRDAGGGDARILVIERTVAPGDDLSSFTGMDLRMLILGSGRERTLEEYAALAARAGLRIEAAAPTPVGVHLVTMR